MTSSLRSLEPVPSEGRSPLVNRSTLRRVLESAQSKGQGVGVVYLDIDRFHQINTRWGRNAGDRVLDVLGPRLGARLPEQAVMTATDGDAYLVVLPGADPAATRATADTLLTAVREAIEFSDITLSVGASAGFSHQEGGDRSVDLVEQAFLACRRAKAAARGTAVGYENALGADVAWQQRTEDGLRRAIADGQLRMHIQPTVDLRDGKVVAVEALVRWEHPVDGLLMPNAFLPVAEAAGLMSEIGDWVLGEALELAARWRRERPDSRTRIWVNLATQQLADGDRLCSRVREQLEAGSIEPYDIGFEVTESSLLEDLPSAVDVLSGLRELGVEIALDDFGTGYSSLSYLRRLPVTAVKIDRVFVAGIGGSLADEAIVEAVIDLAHALGLRVIAEGIEDDVQADALIRLGADEAQGFHFGRPGQVVAVEGVLDRPWGIADPPAASGDDANIDRRADPLPGFGSPRARLLLTALDSAHDSIIVTSAADAVGGGPPIVYVNAAFEAETGYLARDVVGRTLEMLLADPSPSTLAWYADLQAAGRSTTAEVANRRADGSTFLCEVTFSPIYDERGVHTHWLHVRRDLTERRAVEVQLARFQDLIEQSSSLVILTESGGQWLYVNGAQRRALGMTPDEPLDGITTFTMYSEEQLELISTTVMPALDRDGHWSGPTTYVNRVTGAVTEVETDAQVMDDPLRPGVRIFVSVSRDVTEINRARRTELRRRELGDFAAQLAQRALEVDRDELFQDTFSVLEPFAEVLHADLAYLDIIDLDAGLLRPLGDWTSPRYRLPVIPPMTVELSRVPHWIEHLQGPRMVLGSTTDEHTTPWAAELQDVFGMHPGGSNLYAPLRVRNKLVGVLGLSNFDEGHAWTSDEIDMIQQVADTLANLLGRQRSDDALRANEAHLAAMLANVKDVLVVIDRDGVVRYVNDMLERLVGLTPDDVLGRHFLGFIHPDDHGLALSNFAETVAGRDEASLSELRVIAPDGRPAWFEIETSGMFDEVLGGFVLSLRDISVQREAVEAAAQRQQFERVVLSLARWALDTESEEPLAGLTDHLAELGAALGSDAVSVSLLEGPAIRTVAHWHDVATVGDQVTALHVDEGLVRMVPALADRYRSLDPLVVADIDEVDDPWADECRALPVTFRSSLHVPLVSGDRCLGDVGVGMLHDRRAWTSDEVSLVQRVSETLASLLVRQRVEASLRMSEARLGALLDGSHDLVVVVDDEGTLQFANGAVLRRLGYAPEDLVGRNVASVVHPDDLDEALHRLSTLFGAKPTMMITIRLVDASGAYGWWEITSGAIRDSNAEGMVLICRDVTSRLRAEEEHATRIEHLRYAFDLAQSALDLDTQEFLDRLDEVCSSIAALLDVDTVHVDHVDEAAGRLVNRAGTFSAEMRGVMSVGRGIDFEHVPSWVTVLHSSEPIVVDDTSGRHEPWITEKREQMGPEAAFVAVGMSTAGELVGVLGVSMAREPRAWSADDVTFLRIVGETIAHVFERARVDEALRASEARFRLLSETAADVVILLDSVGTVRYASPSSMDLLGYTPEELVGRSARSLVDPHHIGILPAAMPTLLSGLPFTSEGRLIRADGTKVWVANSTSAVMDPASGRPIEYRTSVRDITERKRLEAELERQALHDPLTGLANRILLQTRVAESMITDDPTSDVAVLLLDLDGFKEVNDTFGHAVGDDVLRVVAARLAALSRPTDTLARTGGDEFVVLCPGTDLDAAVAIGERIIAAVSQPIQLVGETVSLGASVGVAHHAGGGANTDTLLLEADSAMYAAKRAGRGRVAIAGDHVRTFGRHPIRP